MRQPKRTVFVDGVRYFVVERAGYVKALMNNYFGWGSVWAEDYISLVKRIRLARRGGQ